MILILRSQERFTTKRNNVFTEEVNKIVLSANDHKRTQSIDFIETCSNGTNKDIMHKNEENMQRYNKTIQKENIKKHNPNWSQIPDNPYRMLIICVSGPEKTNALLNLISHHPDIDKIYFYAKDPCEAICRLLINERKSVGSKD